MTTKTLDIAALSTAELDELIAYLAKHRAERPTPFPDISTTGTPVYQDRRWMVRTITEGTIIEFQHPGFGWVSFLLDRYDHGVLLGILKRVADSAAASPNLPWGVFDDKPSGPFGAH